jgi:hypothetical protein
LFSGGGSLSAIAAIIPNAPKIRNPSSTISLNPTQLSIIQQYKAGVGFRDAFMLLLENDYDWREKLA